MMKIDKKKWENYWYYYKVHTVVAVFALIVLAVSVKSCVERVEPDLTVTYIGSGYIDDAVFTQNSAQISAINGDVNGDGQESVICVPISFADSADMQVQSANMMKAELSVSMGESRIFLMEREYCERYAQYEIFEPIGDLAPEKEGLRDQNGQVIALPVDVSDLGYMGKEPVYLLLRSVTENDQRTLKNIDAMDAAARKVAAYLAQR